jgi:hypothetical protein
MYSLNRRFGFLLLMSTLMFFLFCTSGFAGDAVLSWDANTDPNVAGYIVYYGKAPGSYDVAVDVGNQTKYTITGLGMETYYFAVAAYDKLGNKSGLSNEVSKAFSAGGSSPGGTNSPGVSNLQNGSVAGGCGMVRPTDGKPSNPGKAADMLSVFGMVVLLLAKRGLKTHRIKRLSVWF